MGRLLQLATIIFVMNILIGGHMAAKAAAPETGLATNLNTSNGTQVENIAIFIPARPSLLHATPSPWKPTPIACIHGGNPCSKNSDCCSRKCGPVSDGWKGMRRYCTPDD